LLRVLLEAFSRTAKVRLIDDVVTVEHAAGSMSADLHGHFILNARAFHISHGAQAQIVEQQPRYACAFTCIGPSLR